MNKIRKGDEVFVRVGKDRGKRGSVTKVMPNGRVLVQGINIVKRRTKPNPQLNKPGGIIEKESSLDISNVAIFNPVTEKPDRVGFRSLEDGKKVRFFKSNGEVIDV
jgi:large subunit ribosomal protein L24